MTNNASKSRATYVRRFASLGLDGITARQVVSSSYAAAAYLASIEFNKKVFLIGNRGVEEELNHFGIPFIGGESGPGVPFMGDTDSMLDLEVRHVFVASTSLYVSLIRWSPCPPPSTAGGF